MRNLQWKLLVPLVIMGVFIAAIYVSTLWITNSQKADALVINLAGRQRMLTQKMSKEALAICTGHHEYLEVLPKTMKSFEITLNSLRDGGKAPLDINNPDDPEKQVSLPPAGFKDVYGQLTTVMNLWKPFKDSLLRIISAKGEDEEALKYILGSNVKLLSEMNKAVELFQIHADGKVTLMKNIQLAFLTIGIALVIFFTFYFRRTMYGPIKRLLSAMDKLATGTIDLSYRLPVITKDEIGEMSEKLNAFMDRLRGVIEAVGQQVESLSTAADEISSAVQGMGDTSENVKHYTDEVTNKLSNSSETLSEVDANVQEVAGASVSVADAATELSNNMNDILDSSNKGMQTLDQMVKRVDEVSGQAQKMNDKANQLEKSVNAISEILEMIAGITEQTNLLALNAAIEAARAGEAGKGFAVVADEIRKLAVETRKFTEEIGNKLNEITTNSKDTVEFSKSLAASVQELLENMGDVRRALSLIQEKVESATRRSEDLAAVAEEQSATAEEMAANVQDISKQVSSVSADMENVNNVINNMADFIVEMGAQLDELRKIAENIEVTMKNIGA